LNDAVTRESARRYDLYLREDGRRFFFRYEDHGVTLSADAIAWSSGGSERQEKYENISSVRLQSGSTGQSTTFLCIIEFRDGRVLRVTSASQYGSGDDGQAKIYGQFVRDFHARIPPKAREQIQFRVGNSDSRQTTLWVVLAIATAFFIGMPVVLLLITGDIQALWIALAGCGFLYPVLRSARANQPRDYRCEYPPEDLVPCEEPKT
jgi:hypothetical protein